MADQGDSSLDENQQLALQQYMSITDQDLGTALPLLRRSEWNVQVGQSDLLGQKSYRGLIWMPRLPSLGSSMAIIRIPKPLSRSVALPVYIRRRRTSDDGRTCITPSSTHISLACGDRTCYLRHVFGKQSSCR